MAKDIYIVTTTTADILANPKDLQTISNCDSQLLFGEEFEVISQKGEWLEGVSLIDNYKGYIHQSNLEPKKSAPSHFVDTLLTHIYPAPGFKMRPIMSLSFLSRLNIHDKEENGFIQTDEGWIFEKHIKPLTELKNAPTPLESAMQFLGTPYLYGGRSSLGIDCSGLIQLSLLRSALPCPRDSSEQTKCGKLVELDHHKAGDLVFFTGHVGIFTTENKVLNATARTMDTRIEDLSELTKHYGAITGIRRIG